MQEKLFYIYKITNKINGKIYIGKSVNPHKRFTSHKSIALKNKGDRECIKLYRSIRKYGIDNFSLEIITSFKNEDESYQAEAEFIDKLDTIKNGLNIKSGGKGGCAGGENHPMWGKKHTPESLKKMSEAHIGHKSSEETKEKQRISKSGEKSHYAKLNKNDVEYIRLELNLGTKVKELADKFNVTLTTIYYIRSGTTWR